ncbi:3-hydroxyacyl-ACP dehydratase FabZ [Pseudofulvimonas gallinarii]|jgi:3-hydroxyacyl-[acyl-carrier-protein] dehydratase|uniref:3-hydroxyacyl-[acyl-carrier-protein] dehydratase FabZ n=1 Tax=Pseudofulvimonas gallinarii TaxID=634155 RepID=A0A4R3LJX1_9GAMM|nr:3-hydroxyacyl-ACP dehydratase FabZ [Pseudofulvimonas gallinarii]TCT00121.1 3-hydroxyacyl-[acyl-carrier-protein] dehydratase [Pseudofulvimonas gallinarii]THD13590.1 3-hydroxyacyl-[acyl-carrier-protein] dehydratase FabZ [Pseudofulvimonas gallinarii]
MSETTAPIADIEAIHRMLPHRYPFLLVDRVVSFEPGRSIRALKNVTGNEHFFQGHFPGHPVMPGVLIIEALAQAAGLLAKLSADAAPPEEAGKQALFYLVKIDNARFSKLVVPGDQLSLEVEQKRIIRGMGLYHGVAKVDGNEVACAEVLCAGRSG